MLYNKLNLTGVLEGQRDIVSAEEAMIAEETPLAQNEADVVPIMMILIMLNHLVYKM